YASIRPSRFLEMMKLAFRTWLAASALMLGVLAAAFSSAKSPAPDTNRAIPVTVVSRNGPLLRQQLVVAGVSLTAIRSALLRSPVAARERQTGWPKLQMPAGKDFFVGVVWQNCNRMKSVTGRLVGE